MTMNKGMRNGVRKAEVKQSRAGLREYSRLEDEKRTE